MFRKGDEVYFSEVSPRPHDTGLVTLIRSHSQSLPCVCARLAWFAGYEARCGALSLRSFARRGVLRASRFSRC